MTKLTKDIAQTYAEMSKVQANKAIIDFYWGDRTESADMDVFSKYGS